MSNLSNRFSSPFYRIIRLAAVLIIRIGFRFEVENRAYVPTQGSCIIASNHIHNFDPILVGAAVPRFVEFMAKAELFRVPVLTPLVRYLGAFPIRRGGTDKAGLKRALDVPKRNGCLVIFPEGSRSKDGEVGKGMPGVALIARRANCPIVPCAIVGSYGFRHRLILRFGNPIIPADDDTNETLLDKLMTQIRLLHRLSNPEQA